MARLVSLKVLQVCAS